MLEQVGNLLFIIPDFLYIEDYQKLLYYNDIPLGTLQISSYLRSRKNIKTNIIDLRLEQEKYPNLAIKEPFEFNEKKLTNPFLKTNTRQVDGDFDRFKKSFFQCLEKKGIQEFDNIGINCYTSYQYSYTNFIATLIKCEFPKKNIIVGGYHPTGVPEDFTYKNSPFNFIIKGEAELILIDLLESGILKGNGKPNIFNSKNCIDINTLPFPDYELYLTQYPFKNKFKFEFYMSRGCPYQCAFCALNFPFRNVTFEKFKEDFTRLCQLVGDYNPNLLKIAFADQSFGRVSISEKVLEYIIQNNFSDTFNFSCQSRVENFEDRSNLIKKYREANMIIGFGFESANKNLLIEMHKTETPKKYIQTMEKILDHYKKANGPYCRINLLAGFPGEDHHSFNETMEFVNDNCLHKNIQISPTLFSNYPNVFVYKNMVYYRKKYGSKFIKAWWKLPSNPFKNSVLKKVSKNYSRKQLIGDYKDNYFEILRAWNGEIFRDLLHWKLFFNNWYKQL
ncbi:MAG: B12-binding domain-containing radical SAM protein [Promethearchaeota archaeon]|nr:MAG: B12-binding domain-containing radical SAM protein [Candidatus Lokiarchaeota archaeon]